MRHQAQQATRRDPMHGPFQGLATPAWPAKAEDRQAGRQPVDRTEAVSTATRRHIECPSNKDNNIDLPSSASSRSFSQLPKKVP